MYVYPHSGAYLQWDHSWEAGAYSRKLFQTIANALEIIKKGSDNVGYHGKPIVKRLSEMPAKGMEKRVMGAVHVYSLLGTYTLIVGDISQTVLLSIQHLKF